MDLDSLGWFTIAAGLFGVLSEYIGMNKKLKENSIVEVGMAILGRIFKK